MPYPMGRLRTLKGSGGIFIEGFLQPPYTKRFLCKNCYNSRLSSSGAANAFKIPTKERSVIMCDFRGYEEPEMVKKRPVVVIARNRHNGKLVTVVPLSSTNLSFGGLPPQNGENPYRTSRTSMSGKCDMTATVGLARLDRYKPKGRDRCIPIISEEDFQAVKQPLPRHSNCTRIKPFLKGACKTVRNMGSRAGDRR